MGTLLVSLTSKRIRWISYTSTLLEMTSGATSPFTTFLLALISVFMMLLQIAIFWHLTVSAGFYKSIYVPQRITSCHCAFACRCVAFPLGCAPACADSVANRIETSTGGR